MAFFNDFLVQLLVHSDKDYYTESDSEKEESLFSLAVSVILAAAITFIFIPYTIIIVFSTTRRKYITGDFLYDKQINDNLSLLKTVQVVCGYSFSLIFCNLYFWRFIYKYGHLGKPIFYKEFVIPDYTIIYGISVYMIAKIIVIAISILTSLVLSKQLFLFGGDLGEYDLHQICGGSFKYGENEFKKVLKEKKEINNILNQN